MSKIELTASYTHVYYKVVLLGSADYQAPVYQFQMHPKRVKDFSEGSAEARGTIR